MLSIQQNAEGKKKESKKKRLIPHIVYMQWG